jgi:hypothetical protein
MIPSGNLHLFTFCLIPPIILLIANTLMTGYTHNYCWSNTSLPEQDHERTC